MSEFKKYNRKSVPAEMRPYVIGENLDGISVGNDDIEKGYLDREGSMIARDPDNHDDQWFVNADYFQDKFHITPIE